MSKAAKPIPAQSSLKPSEANQGVPDEIIFETFFHQDGKSYCCIFANGERHYLDSFQSGQWLMFPKGWYDSGVLVADDMDNHDPETISNDKNEYKIKDDREGNIKIPGKGEYITYIFERKQNVHCYYDKREGAWLCLPISWELYSKQIVAEIRKVKDVCPQWIDEADILASLRASNYNVDNCINNYAATLNIDDSKRNVSQSVKSIIEEAYNLQNLEKKVKHLTSRLNELLVHLKQEKEQKEFLQKKNTEIEELYSSLKAEQNTLKAQLASAQKSSSLEMKKIVQAKASSIDPSTLKSLTMFVTNLKKIQLQSKSEISDYKIIITNKITEMNNQTKQLQKYANSHGDEIESLKNLYRREGMQRKLLYNQLQELRGNIRVFSRIRQDRKCKSLLKIFDDEITLSLPNGHLKQFQFDKIFGPDSKQEEIFADVSPIITSCIDGYNVTIIAYGQTGSGKTYTMQGPDNDRGVNMRSIEELLKICKSRTNVNFELSVSMVEIYNEVVQDLLSAKVETVELRSGGGHEVTIAGVTNLPVKTSNDILKIMTMGQSNRTVAETKMNSTSSRSHLLLTVTVNGSDKLSGINTKGQLNLVDLAGSERVSKTDATGSRLTEAAFINKSLTSLGQVFQALRTNQLHVPYRNSKLTHILEPSLGGDAKACLFVNISPAESNIQETLSSLQFGSNARQVALGQAKPNVQKVAATK